MSPRSIPLAVALALSGMAIQAQAVPVVFSTAPGAVAASVSFDVSGNQLLIRLTNTGTGDPSSPSQILTGVIFNIVGNPTLTAVSAILAPGSSVIHGPAVPTDPGGAVGGEWAYDNQLGGGFAGKQSVYSSGYFSGNNLFGGTNLQGPDSVDGIQYGITTLSDTTANDNGGIDTAGLIKNAVDFVLTGLPQGFTLGMISNVSFQYGTSLTEPNIVANCTPNCPRTTQLPEPASPALLGLGLAAAAAVGMLRRRGART
ncbi:XDD4 family exosortase-dependent surface protein [Uliginosibacterium sp. sgz301328]|uniref:XDD4 family exosortase-dependent surface protein n=1 Tax=Uliginosibacterium sp. sgz301328 TaxID=3243764 RepID=UPI00359CE0D1